MSFGWISLSLLYAASFLISASSNKRIFYYLACTASKYTVHCKYFMMDVISFIALISHSGVSNPGVSLNCNETVKVVAGETVTLNCTISVLGTDCSGQSYNWNNSHGKITCDSGDMKYKCEWDNQTYVMLTISNDVKEDNYTVHIWTNCGTAKSSVHVQHTNSTHGE